jgi:O-antigen/teichoic acid export membrane protein
MGLRLTAIAVAAPHGVLWIIAAMAAAQALSTAAILAAGFRSLARFPAADAVPLGADALELRRFVFHSTVGSSLVSLRSTLPMNLVGGIMSKQAAADFRVAQAPQTALASLAGPGRLILLAEQSRHFEAGRIDRVYDMIRRYMLLSAVPLVVVVPVGWLAMPWLLRTVLKPEYASAADAARLILLTGAIQILWGWTRPFAVAVGRPGLRALTYAAELAVLVPGVLLLGHAWGAAGAAGGVLAGSVAFAAVWTALLVRLRRRPVVPVRSVEAL